MSRRSRILQGPCAAFGGLVSFSPNINKYDEEMAGGEKDGILPSLFKGQGEDK